MLVFSTFKRLSKRKITSLVTALVTLTVIQVIMFFIIRQTGKISYFSMQKIYLGFFEFFQLYNQENWISLVSFVSILILNSLVPWKQEFLWKNDEMYDEYRQKNISFKNLVIANVGSSVMWLTILSLWKVIVNIILLSASSQAGRLTVKFYFRSFFFYRTDIFLFKFLIAILYYMFFAFVISMTISFIHLWGVKMIKTKQWNYNQLQAEKLFRKLAVIFLVLLYFFRIILIIVLSQLHLAATVLNVSVGMGIFLLIISLLALFKLQEYLDSEDNY